ncbi:MAG: YtxH domain-containing protein [Oligoflexus sp.]|nr:YtxH domain-containing protein [Pseudopedobacter sp.]
MKLFNLIALGAAAAYGYNYITKKDALGKSKLDNIKENAPDWIDKAKKMGKDAMDNINQPGSSVNYNNQGY